MNITFLIGNGYDLNLGLSTQYKDFLKFYKNTECITKPLLDLRMNISENIVAWSDAEIEFGRYTANFTSGDAFKFSECHTDFCEKLSRYLTEEETYVDYEKNSEKIVSAYSNLNHFFQEFPMQEREEIYRVIERYKSEEIIYNFICFNYTRTLDKCVEIVKKASDYIGYHKYGNNNIKHRIGTICHVHGTVEKEMVFGVNDESQISNLSIFDCEYGDLYKNTFVKIKANESYLENTDFKADNLINNSNIIYIYGMSIGETDKLWWNRICKWLLMGKDRHLIIHKFDMPQKEVVPIRYLITERDAKRSFVYHAFPEQDLKEDDEKRIHITKHNIFEEINGIASEREKVEHILQTV